MHRFLHDYSWVYIVVIIVSFDAVFYFTPQLVMKLLNKGDRVSEHQAGCVEKK